LRFQRKKNTDISLDVTPLVDVIFLLLIFFVLSTNFIDIKTMNINLPSVQDLSMNNSLEEKVSIEILKGGRVLINNKELEEFSLKSLNNELNLISSDISSAVISADSDTKYQYLVTIMEVLNKNNFKSIQMNGVSIAE
jgi:biopolymer transport protein ExbD|tara:strand:- start:14909 stop:15322 length:414 start_codon:yes stop_codon:yes gene_type:complete